MGILIELTDQDYKYCQDYANGKTNILALNNTSRVIKAVANGTHYENRLKADMVAMLTDLQLDVEEQKFDVHIDRNMWNDAIGVCSELIQQKINKLKENRNEI